MSITALCNVEYGTHAGKTDLQRTICFRPSLSTGKGLAWDTIKACRCMVHPCTIQWAAEYLEATGTGDKRT